jgi:hypothetical protein
VTRDEGELGEAKDNNLKRAGVSKYFIMGTHRLGNYFMAPNFLTLFVYKEQLSQFLIFKINTLLVYQLIRLY